MYRKIFVIALSIMLSSLALAQARTCWMVPQPLVLLTEGIQGGIAPRPIPFQLIVIPGSDHSARLLVLHRDAQGTATYTQGRGPGFPDLQQEFSALGLYALPQEKEPGLADPYGLSIALHSHDGQRCWVNDPPNGCVRGPQTVKPSAEQKATFAALVKRLEKLAGQATEPLSEKEYQETLASLFARQ